MDVIHFPDSPRPDHWRAPILALGNFDGVHRGHVKILERVQRGAQEHGVTPVVLTFDPHPTRVTRPERAPQLLMTLEQKLDVLRRADIAGVAIVRFTADMASWSPDEFVRRVLVGWLGVSEVWVGANFLFGKDRSGDVATLRALGLAYGFRAEKIDPVRYKDVIVSSTGVRRLIAEGRVGDASALLGRQYFIDGVVVHGDGRGRTIGYPTANLQTSNELLPARGVYASIAGLGGTMFPAVTNVGVRPTFGDGHAVSVETYVLGLSQDLYGQTMRLYFVERLRDEQTFSGIEALTEQIGRDCQAAHALFDRVSV